MRTLVSVILSLSLIQAAQAGRDHDHKNKHHQHEHHQHDAHSHGAAHLNIAIDGSQLLIEFRSPAANIVGFEHQPRTPQQRQQITTAVEQLRQAEQLFITQGTSCRLEQHDIVTDLLSKHDHSHRHDDKHDAHSDFDANYALRCDNTAALTGINVALFKQFPAIESIAVQFITPAKQGGTNLTADKSFIQF